jgi:hypothetical protein
LKPFLGSLLQIPGFTNAQAPIAFSTFTFQPLFRTHIFSSNNTAHRFSLSPLTRPSSLDAAAASLWERCCWRRARQGRYAGVGGGKMTSGRVSNVGSWKKRDVAIINQQQCPKQPNQSSKKRSLPSPLLRQRDRLNHPPPHSTILQHPLEARKKEAQKMKEKYSDRIPVIVEKAPGRSLPPSISPFSSSALLPSTYRSSYSTLPSFISPSLPSCSPIPFLSPSYIRLHSALFVAFPIAPHSHHNCTRQLRFISQIIMRQLQNISSYHYTPIIL